MELTGSKQGMATRLAACAVLALLLYSGGEKLCTTARIPLWEQYRPWLEKNKLQAIAGLAALFFVLSLVVFPLDQEEDCPGEEHGAQPCEDAFP